MNILFTLCGRAGSKGVKGKNARDFLGIPLAWYSMAGIALYSERFLTAMDHVDIVLNTDSEDLINLVRVVKDLDITILHRENRLAGDSIPKDTVILDCLNRSESLFNIVYDVVVDLDITSPLRTVQAIKNAIDKKISRKETDVVYSVVPSRRNPFFNMVKEENGFFCKAIPSKFTTRQEAPIFYDMNASIYAYSPKALREKEHTTFFNSNCDAIVMSDTGVLDIDSEDDYELMQVIAKHLFESRKDFKEIWQKACSWRQ